MIKQSKTYYSTTFKFYETAGQLIEENGYGEFKDFLLNVLSSLGITTFIYDLSSDQTCLLTTIEFADDLQEFEYNKEVEKYTGIIPPYSESSVHLI